jgi:PAS domain S-box-containing protein
MADAELPKDKKQVNAQSARLKELRETLIELEKKKSELEKLLKKRSRQVETLSKQRTMDIAEQLIIEEALRQSERFYSNIFSSMLDGMSILDKDLSIIKVNAVMEQWYPHFLPLEGKKCYEVYHQADKPCEICPSLVTLQTGKSAHEIVPKRLNDGVICGWTDLHTFPLVDAATGEIKGVIENIRDITDRKKIEEDLRQSEEKFRTLANTVSAGIVIIKNGKFSYVNQYLLDSTEYTFEELLSVDFLEVIHPDYRDEIRLRQAQRMRGEETPTEFQFKILMKNGGEAWVHQNAALIRFEGELATLATVWDITEQKKIEQALAAEKERLDVTLSSIGDSVISTDIDTNIITINKIAETLTGFSKEKAVGRPLDEICRIVNKKTRETHERIFKPMVEKHGIVPYKRHVVMLAGDGAEHQVDMSVAPIRSDDGTVIGMVIVFRDITEHQKLETELFKARKLESLGVLAGGIAHDFNNILTGIITNLFMAKITMPTTSESYKLLVDAKGLL